MIQILKDVYHKHQFIFQYMFFWFVTLIIIVALYFIAKMIYVKVKKSKGEEVEKGYFFDLVLSKRYYIAGILLIILTIFQISGSSIGIWAYYIPNELETSGELIGESQAIRTDEWATFTPFALSQKYNNYGYFSNIIRADKTDVYLEYGAPVFNIGIIFRLFQIGYLLLGQSMGLAFYWSARFIAILLATYEFMMLISNNKKKLSIAGSMLISFSPVVCWWFSINGLIEMIVSMEFAIVLFDRYLQLLDKNKKDEKHIALKKLLHLIGIAICAGTFIFTFYPSWQVPFAYVIVFTAIWVLVKNIKIISMNKIDIIQIAIVLIVFIMIVAYLLVNSLDTIKAILNTVYPGSRVETGGGALIRYVQAPTNLFYLLNTDNILLNTCEEAFIFDFFPMGIIFALFVLIKQKKNDLLLVLLMLLEAFFAVWCIFGFPEMLAKITLMSFSQSTRTYIIVGFIHVMLLIRSMSLLKEEYGIIQSVVMSTIIAAAMTFIISYVFGYYLWLYMELILFALLIVCYYCVFRARFEMAQSIFVFIVCIIGIVGGLIVNPIRSGLGIIYDMPIVQSIEKITNENPDDIWIVEDLGHPYINIPIMAGARTINSTNVYPNIDFWNKLDVEKQNEDIYNRYSHIKIVLTKDETSFELENSDSVIVNVNINDLAKMNVNYIMTKNDLSVFNGDDVLFDKIDEQNEFYIYRVQYY